MKKKPKKYDPATYMRFKREKRCFEPEHDQKIEDLSSAIEEKVKLIATLEEALSNLKAEKLSMITQGEAEEAKISSKLEGYREGEKDTEERLRKEKYCFDAFHRFYEGKKIMNLTFSQTMDLFLYLTTNPVSSSEGDKITVFVPSGFQPGASVKGKMAEKSFNMAIEAVFRKIPFIR